MNTVTVNEARRQLGRLVDNAVRGQAVEITRRGRKVARIVACDASANRKLPDLTDFRSSIAVKGKSLSGIVVAQRRSARY